MAVQTQIAVATPLRRPTSTTARAWARFRANPAAVAGLVLVTLLLLLAVVAPLLFPYDARASDLGMRLKPPSPAHPLGTDNLGRDVLLRLLHGAHRSLGVGFFSVLLGVVVGTTLGTLAGYLGGWPDGLLMRMMDVILAFPSTLLAIAIVAMRGPGLFNTMLAVGIVSIPIYARLVRSMVLTIKERDFVLAARSLGTPPARILLSHILPNSLSPIIVQGTLGIATAIIEAAALGFLGLGQQPPDPEWGQMLTDARNFLLNAPWAMIFPGAAIMISVLAFNLLGDGIRDALDPRLRP